jgi:hypothetical protein
MENLGRYIFFIRVISKDRFNLTESLKIGRNSHISQEKDLPLGSMI